MAKSLVIVESPAKVKTINKFLGSKFKVTASMGHVIDLPKSKIGIDVDNDFAMSTVVMRIKQKTLTKLKKEIKDVETVYVATDPDREGEAIGWNLMERIGQGKKIVREVAGVGGHGPRRRVGRKLGQPASISAPRPAPTVS